MLKFIIGFIVGCITCFLVELLCVLSDEDGLDTWTYSEKDAEPPNSHVDED